MGGIWKLAAMSGVIGAGLVVVYQAQLGLQQSSTNAVSSTSARPDSGPDSVADPELAVPPAEAGELIPKRSLEPVASAANASVPPEPEEASAALSFDGPGLTPIPQSNDVAAPSLLPADASSAHPAVTPGLSLARYQRKTPGKDGAKSSGKFRENDVSAKPIPDAASSMEPTADARVEPTGRGLDFGEATGAPRLMLPDDKAQPVAGPQGIRARSGEVRLTSASDSAPMPAEEEDPFADSAPPEFAPPPAAPASNRAATKDEEEFDPFAPAKTPPAASDSTAPQLPAGKPKAKPSSEAQPIQPKPALPTDLDEDPFAPQPAAPQPSRDPEASTPAPLPLNGLPGGTPMSPASAPAINSRSRTEEPPTAPPARSSRGAAATPDTPVKPKSTDLLVGDGEVPATTPRGVQEPRLTIEKLAPTKAVLGQPLVYTVIVKNVGGSPASQVVVEDRIPKGSRMVGSAPRAELVDKRLIWKLGTLQPGDERKISMKVIPEEEGPIGSVAKVNFVSEVAAEIVVTAPRLKLAVESPSEAKMGAGVPMVFRISNLGNGEASNVVIRSIIPEGLQHPAGSDLEYSVGTLAANETREVRLELTAAKLGRTVQHSIVTADGNLNAEAKTPVDVIGEQLLLTRSGLNRVFSGRNIVFTNQVKNEGQRPVEKVQIIETVPDGFEFVTANRGGEFDSSQRTVTWSIGTLAPGASDSVSITLLAKSIGTQAARVKAVGGSGTSASLDASVGIEGIPSLALERLGEARVVGVGETVTSKVQLQNRGSATAKNVGLTVELPAEMRFVSASGPTKFEVSGQRLVFAPLDTLAPQASVGYEVVLQAQAAGDTRIEMQISADHLRRPVRHEEAVQVVAENQ